MLQLHPGHLACFHTANTSNYITHLFLAELTSERKVLNHILKCSEIRIHRHTSYRAFAFFHFSDLPNKVKKEIVELFQPSQTT